MVFPLSGSRRTDILSRRYWKAADVVASCRQPLKRRANNVFLAMIELSADLESRAIPNGRKDHRVCVLKIDIIIRASDFELPIRCTRTLKNLGMLD
jgi:hypothetical protein